MEGMAILSAVAGVAVMVVHYTATQLNWTVPLSVPSRPPTPTSSPASILSLLLDN